MGDLKLKIDALADCKKQIEIASEMLDELGDNLSNVQLFCDIGDRFNGLIGTFSFDSGIELFEELVDISRMIDNVVVIYKKDAIPQIRDDHLSFVQQANKLLQAMIELHISEGDLSSLRSEKSAMTQVYNELEEVEEKEVMDQDAVDKLLDDLL